MSTFLSNQRHLASVKNTQLLFTCSILSSGTYPMWHLDTFSMNSIKQLSILSLWWSHDTQITKEINHLLTKHYCTVIFRNVTAHEISIFFSQAYSWVKQDVRHITELSCIVNISGTPLRLIFYIPMSYGLFSKRKDKSMLSTYSI